MVAEFSKRWQGFVLKTVVACLVNSSRLLFICGVVLLTGGLWELSRAEGGRDPEPAYAKPVEFSWTRGVEATQIKEIEATAPAATPQNNDIPYDDDLVEGAVGNILMFIEGSFGALIMVCAGLGAIVAACMGGYKAALTLLFIAVGAFILRSLVSLFFGSDYDPYFADGTIGPRVPGRP